MSEGSPRAAEVCAPTSAHAPSSSGGGPARPGRRAGRAGAICLLAWALVGCGADDPSPEAPATTARDGAAAAPVMRLLPDNLLFVAGDPRLSTQVGQRDGRRAIESTGKAGALVFGPYVALKRGRYEVTWYGWMRGPDGLEGVRFDVVVARGGTVVAVGSPQPKPAGAEEPFALARTSIDLPSDVKDLETRVFVSPGSRVAFSHVEIREVRR